MAMGDTSTFVIIQCLKSVQDQLTIAFFNKNGHIMLIMSREPNRKTITFRMITNIIFHFLVTHSNSYQSGVNSANREDFSIQVIARHYVVRVIKQLNALVQLV
ncbi:hypothetical protein DPMN_149396 [Dreissena polymorpha]|uniref:Uncharacterized protein n=1 Tax=Dreissena polymorpha TaxID=45954 RepID=A0A9D4FBN8_DREPO|nr:hypothetical protein DPMN_149396 [Dreissena polymorpha]